MPASTCQLRGTHVILLLASCFNCHLKRQRQQQLLNRKTTYRNVCLRRTELCNDFRATFIEPAQRGKVLVNGVQLVAK